MWKHGRSRPRQLLLYPVVLAVQQVLPWDQLFSWYWYYAWQVNLSLESAERGLEEVGSAT